MSNSDTRIDEIVDGIFRISTWQEPYGITFNQFLIADERPALIHTGMHHLYDNVRNAIAQVLDPASLSCIVLLHWEGDENGGMEEFMRTAPQAELIGSLLSIQLNASGFGVTQRVRGFRDGETLELGRRMLRFLETPHVHHWDSMMVLDETEDLSRPMLDLYRAAGIFAHELPIRQVVDRLEKTALAWIHPMHGGSFRREEFDCYARALRENEFAYRGVLLGREIARAAPM